MRNYRLLFFFRKSVMYSLGLQIQTHYGTQMFKKDLEILIVLLLPSTCWKCRHVSSLRLQIRDFERAVFLQITLQSLISIYVTFTQIFILSSFSVDHLRKLTWSTDYSIFNPIIQSLRFIFFLILFVELTPILLWNSAFYLVKISIFLFFDQYFHVRL